MLTKRELATLRAALLFWREEMHTPELMLPYLEPPDAEPLLADDLDRLRSTLEPSCLRYAVYLPAADRFATRRVFDQLDQATEIAEAGERVVTVLLSA